MAAIFVQGRWVMATPYLHGWGGGGYQKYIVDPLERKISLYNLLRVH